MVDSFSVTLWAPDDELNSESYARKLSGDKEKEAQTIHILEVMESHYNPDLDRYEFPSREDMYLAVEKLIGLLYLV